MSRLVVLPMAAPLLGAAACALAPRRARSFQRVMGLGVPAGLLAVAIALVVATRDGTVLVTQVGGFPAGIAIPFAADLFSALMLVVAALMVLVCAAFAVVRQEDHQWAFHPLTLVLLGGISSAFLTADLFNLFVSFEVMLIASYVLLTLEGDRGAIRAGAIYVTTNLLGSTVLVAGIALVYAATGTVNMASLASGEIGGGMRVAGALLLLAFAVKGSLVPVHGWLPSAYPATSPAVAAMFSGLLTKVGIYALYRVFSVVYRGDPGFRTALLVIASATMAIGVLGAIGRGTMREILSFHITSQVGYMVMGLGLFGPIGLAGGIFYILHHIVVKTSLFLAAGAVETEYGTGALDQLGGVARRRPVLTASFGIAALSLAGLPPFSGFFAKILLVRASFEGGEFGVAAVSVAVSFVTLASMAKIWNGVFWGWGGSEAETVLRISAARLAAPAVVLSGISIAIGFGAHWLLELTTRAAEGLIDPTAYIEAVLNR